MLFQIQLLADLNLKKTPQLVELVDDSKVISKWFPIFIGCKNITMSVFQVLNFVTLYLEYQDVEELMSLAPEKILLRWMNFQLKKAGYTKTVTNFSSDVKVTENELI